MNILPNSPAFLEDNFIYNTKNLQIGMSEHFFKLWKRWIFKYFVNDTIIVTAFWNIVSTKYNW